ncbi:MAG: hypothetical protein WC457_02120 [Patescibacteria group bacterium]
MRSSIPFTIAAVVRHAGLAITVLRGHEVIEINKTRITSSEKLGRVVAKYINEAADDYEAEKIIVERNSSVHRILRKRCCSGERLFTVDPRDIKRLALRDEPCATNRALLARLIRRYPKLARFVAVHRDTGELGWNDPRRTAALLAVALGFAAQNVTQNVADHGDSNIHS